MKTARDLAHEAMAFDCPAAGGHYWQCDRVTAAIEARDEEWNRNINANDRDWEARQAAVEAQLDTMTKHAQEGWDLANHRTRQWRAVEAQLGEANRLLYDAQVLLVVLTGDMVGSDHRAGPAAKLYNDIATHLAASPASPPIPANGSLQGTSKDASPPVLLDPSPGVG